MQSMRGRRRVRVDALCGGWWEDDRLLREREKVKVRETGGSVTRTETMAFEEKMASLQEDHLQYLYPGD